MKVFFAQPDIPPQYSTVPMYRDRLREQRDKRHKVVDDPVEADLVLFTDCHMLECNWRLEVICGSRVARRYYAKTAVYNERDHPWCRLPGIYMSMPARSFQARWQLAGSYWTTEDPAERLTDLGAREKIDPDLLFSFVGSISHSCRSAILELGESRRSHVESIDSFAFWDPSSKNFEERRRRFAEVLFRSKFVLCPRGQGTSSFRLYETLAAGRAPVIVADDWVPPEGPEWGSFSVRWPQRRLRELPERLALLEDRAAEMGRLARRAYEEWFAQDVVMTRQLDRFEQLMTKNDLGRFPRGGVRNAAYASAYARAVGHGVLPARARSRLHAAVTRHRPEPSR